jgi:dipeptidyl aminopeptidase/acylaminoacyl peptidase
MSRLKTLLILVLACSFVACTSGPQPAPDTEKAPAGVALIPRAVLFDNPEKSSAQLSPDGTRLSYLAPVDGVLNIWVQTPGQEDAKPVTKDKKRGVRIYFWTEDSKYLIYLQDKGGDENWQVHQVNPETAEDKTLTPFDEVRSGIVALSKRKPDEMLIQMNRRNKTVFDVYRVDLKTGKMEIDTLNPGHVMMWLADDDLQVRAGVAFDQEGQTLLLVRDTVKDKWRLLRSWTPLEEGGAVTFSADGKSLMVVGNKDTDTKRLYSMEIKTGKITEIFHNPEADFVDGLIHPDDKVVEAVANERLRKKWTILDKRVEKDFEILRQLGQDDFKVVSRTADDKKWIVAVSKDIRGRVYYLYDRAAGKTTHLFDARPKLKEYQLAPMKPLEIKSRDGLSLVSYLTVPPQAKEGEKLPMVLLVHGGPWWRDFWGYEPEAQWLANRGYAVLQVNFRTASARSS